MFTRGIQNHTKTQHRYRNSIINRLVISTKHFSTAPSLACNLSTQITNEHRDQFNSDGFILFPSFINPDIASQCANRLKPLFHGDFETGVYPDEWTWRPKISQNNVTREICNAWKSDKLIAQVVLSSQIGRIAAQLCGWKGARVAQDDIWWKPAGAKAISYHRDIDYFDFIRPKEVLTCWIALHETDHAMGTLEYVCGSHQWDRSLTRKEPLTQGFHAPSDYLADVVKAAIDSGVDHNNLDIVKAILPAGGAAFHHSYLWHGSGENKYKPSNDGYGDENDESHARKALAIHFIPSDAVFSNHSGVRVGYTYGRYKFWDSNKMHEQFFPITWAGDGDTQRSGWLDAFVEDSVEVIGALEPASGRRRHFE